MGAADLVALAVTHPNEFRTLCQFWLYHEQKRDITAASEFETSGYDRPSMKRCWYFLDMTSRSFSAVIKELDGDLARVVSSGFVLSPFGHVAGCEKLSYVVSDACFNLKSRSACSTSSYGDSTPLKMT